jgi:hypothetical protein
MSRLYIATRGLGDWRSRLANPDRQWKRHYSAFETAVSWEYAACSGTGLPVPVAKLLHSGGYENAILVSAVAEHKVTLPGGGGASQCDVWALVNTALGTLSLSVEAKVEEAFGNEMLEQWLDSGKLPDSSLNRRKRWDHIQKYLPSADSYSRVRYQILHRCAAAVIEAERLGLKHAAFVVQAFETPAERFHDFEEFCRVLRIPAERGRLAITPVGEVSLGLGWADCQFATDKEVAEVA